MAPGAFPVSGLWRQSLPAGCVSLRRRFQQPAMSRPSVTMPASAAARATSNRPPVSGIMAPGTSRLPTVTVEPSWPLIRALASALEPVTVTVALSTPPLTWIVQYVPEPGSS